MNKPECTKHTQNATLLKKAVLGIPVFPEIHKLFGSFYTGCTNKVP